jgi:hypothetical protein
MQQEDTGFSGHQVRYVIEKKWSRSGSNRRPLECDMVPDPYDH